MAEKTNKKQEIESQKASRQVHEGGRYVVKNGIPVKDTGKPAPASKQVKELN